MKTDNEKLELVDRLISHVRYSMKRAGPDLIIFAAEELRHLQSKRDDLVAQGQPADQKHEVAA